MSIDFHDQQHPVAETFAGGSIVAVIGSHLAQINEIVQIIAGIVAIIAGIVSVVLRWTGRRRDKRERRE